jgi:hypothetical protein
MTGTVTGDMGSSVVHGRTVACDVPKFFDDFGAMYRCAPGVGWAGSRLSDRFQRHGLDQYRELQTAVPILSLGTTESSRRRLSTKRSRR